MKKVLSASFIIPKNCIFPDTSINQVKIFKIILPNFSGWKNRIKMLHISAEPLKSKCSPTAAMQNAVRWAEFRMGNSDICRIITKRHNLYIYLCSDQIINVTMRPTNLYSHSLIVWNFNSLPKESIFFLKIYCFWRKFVNKCIFLLLEANNLPKKGKMAMSA